MFTIFAQQPGDNPLSRGQELRVHKIEIQFADTDGNLHNLTIRESDHLDSLDVLGDSAIAIRPDSANTFKITTEGW